MKKTDFRTKRKAQQEANQEEHEQELRLWQELAEQVQRLREELIDNDEEKDAGK